MGLDELIRGLKYIALYLPWTELRKKAESILTQAVERLEAQQARIRELEELQKLEQQLAQAQKAALVGSPDVAVFKSVFGAVQADFDRLREALEKVRQSDAQVAGKLTAAVKALLDKLAADIGG